MNAGRWAEGVRLRAELIQRLEAENAAAPTAAERRRLTATWLPRYREYAAALAVVGRRADAHAAAELARTRALADLSGVGDGARAPRVVPAEELQALLPSDALYLGYLTQANLFLIVAVSRKGVELYRPPLARGLPATIAAWRYLLAIPAEWRAKIAGLPKVWRRADGSFQVAAKPPQPGAAQVESADGVAAWLGERLLGPAAKTIAGARRLIVSPDADLAFVPFEALRLGGRYLVESHEVHYAGTAALYARARARAERDSRPSRGLLAFGGALYDPFVQVTPLLNVHRELLQGVPREPRVGRPEAGGLAEAFRTLKIAWGDLPGTAEEAAHLAALFEGSRVLSGADASERRLAELDASGELARYRYLVFATHGYLSPYDPRLSSIVLSQAGNEAPYDGYATAAEWAGLRLRSELVVVSASNSGFGRVAGAAGLLGLPYALQLAGNRNTAMSLWTLNDPRSARLVHDFLSRVRDGAEHAAALAAAKRARIAEGVPASYWAALVLHGG